MSEDSIEAPIAGFTLEQIRAFFSHVGGRNPCEACGNDRWANLPSNIPIQMAHADGSGYGVQFLSFFCTNCGNTRLFNAARVRHFIEHELGESDNARP